MYGLVHASRGFWLEVDSFLISVGCQKSIFDKALYFYYVDGVISFNNNVINNFFFI
jgi:hypothetical protein